MYREQILALLDSGLYLAASLSHPRCQFTMSRSSQKEADWRYWNRIVGGGNRAGIIGRHSVSASVIACNSICKGKGGLFMLWIMLEGDSCSPVLIIRLD